MKLKVAIIAPPYPLEEAPAPPLGICYAAAAFERAGCEVQIFDYVVRGYTDARLRAQIEAFTPDIVGTNSVTLNFPQAAEILSKAKDMAPNAITMMGGPHVSFYVPETLARYPKIDIIAIGEGEAAIEDFVPKAKDRAAWETVAGIAFRKDGQVHYTPKRELIADLDTLPMPSRHLLPLTRYKALGFPVSIITSRGCPNQCIFCLGRRMVGHKVRYRSIQKVADEIAHLISMGFTRINVADDLFTASRPRVRELCQEIKRRKLEFGWSAFSRVNTVDEDIFRLMRETGCDCISFGIESGNAEMLKRIKKGITREQVLNAVAICKRVGMKAHASFIVGLPGETLETLEETDKFAVSLDILHGYHFLAPFPGTTIYENLKDYDLEILTDDWTQFDANRPVVRTSKVSPQDMLDFVGRYDAECNRLWAELEEGYVNGTNSPEDNMRIEGSRRLGLVFSILEHDMLERHGAMNGAGSLEEAEKILAGRIAGETGKDLSLVVKVVEDFVRRGFLQLEKGPGGAVWQWTPNPDNALYQAP
jgi:radical SAM superfamily enzyme YgiQ (UPF0313 family)